MPEQWCVLLPNKIHPAGPDSIRDIAEFESVSDFGIHPADLVGEIDRFDAVILRSAQMTRDVIAAADQLRVIAKHGVGTDNIDIPAASERGIVVCNTPGTNSRTVAEGAITLLLATRRNIVQADSAVRDGNWAVRADWDRICRHTIEGETLGIFGYGDIGRETAKLAIGMGMSCVVYDPYLPAAAFGPEVERVTDKAALFEAADAVTIHAPLTDETRHAIGRDELREIEYIVNTARGGIIDESALVEALANDELISAGLDVLDREPPDPDNPLLSRDDVVLSPHLAGISIESTRKMSEHAARNVRTVYDGDLPETTVNADAFDR